MKEEKGLVDLIKSLAYLAFLIALGPVVICYYGYCGAIIWNWFMPYYFDWPAISTYQSAAACMVLGYFNFKITYVMVAELSDKEKSTKWLLYFLMPLALLLTGWLLKFLIM